MKTSRSSLSVFFICVAAFLVIGWVETHGDTRIIVNEVVVFDDAFYAQFGQRVSVIQNSLGNQVIVLHKKYDLGKSLSMGLVVGAGLAIMTYRRKQNENGA